MRQSRIAVFVPHAGCTHRCSFCDQTAIAADTLPTPDTVRAACEQALASGRLDAAHTEIAFFGGSFTAIDRDYMLALLQAAEPFVRRGQVRGIRVSTRPDAVDAAVLALLKEYGVCAVELGAQSMDDAVLAANHRGHTAAQVQTAAGAIRRAELELGLQMMTGLYGSTPDSDRQTAERLIALAPHTVRIYPTVVLEHTALAQWYRQGRYTPPTLEDTVTLCAELLERFQTADIAVIRLGLQASPSLEAAYVAGPWHPSLRELCEAERRRRELVSQLKQHHPQGGAVTVRVHPSEVSRTVGYQRQTCVQLQQQGYAVTVTADVAVPRGSVVIE